MAKHRGFTDLIGALEKSNACADHPPIRQCQSPTEAAHQWENVQHCAAHLRREHLRWLGRHDLYFLLVYLLNRKHFLSDERKTRWTFDRCKEVQAQPDNTLDLWPREHFKSEIITFGLTIQDVLNDPEVTIGIFSHNRPMAKDFLVLCKREFESNELLKDLYDDVLWANPRLECRAASLSWSENEGITVRRHGNPKEATIEAWGLVDGQPTGKRFRRLVYDDVVARDNTSPLMIQITTEQFDNSLLLTASDPPIFRYIATFQEFGDTTTQLIKRNVGKLRHRGPFDDDHKPACFSDEKLAWMKANLGPKTFALQILLDPTQAKDPAEVGFNQNWVDYYDSKDLVLLGMNKYIVVDPAGAGPEANSRFAMWVVALGADKRIRILDMVCDKLDLEERWRAVFEAVQRWEPLKVGYERYGHQSDAEHFRYRMKEINNFFTIIELGGGVSKDGRINWLVPVFRDQRFLFPKDGIIKRLRDGREVNLVRTFLDEEFLTWPYSRQRDMLDALSRLFDPTFNLVWPRRYGASSYEVNSGGGFGNTGSAGGGSWMSA